MCGGVHVQVLQSFSRPYPARFESLTKLSHPLLLLLRGPLCGPLCGPLLHAMSPNAQLLKPRNVTAQLLKPRNVTYSSLLLLHSH